VRKAGAVATIYVHLGDKDRALEWLEKALQDQNSYLVFLKVEPKFDPVRLDPRFVDFMRRIGLD
jgi:hypothetical protein